MTHTLRGYLRDNPGGAAISGKTVSLLDTVTGIAPVTDAYTNLSGTTDTTDADGMWEFTMDLMTGPVRLSVDLGGGDTRHRRNDEVFQYDSFSIVNLPQAFRAIQDGVIKGLGSEFVTNSWSVRTLLIENGYSIIKGHPFGWDSGQKTLVGSANGAVGTTRHDFVVLRQYYDGTSQGKQTIVLVEGGSSTDPVPTTTETTLTNFIQGANIYDLPIYRAKLANGSTLYTLEDLRGAESYPWAGSYISSVDNNVTFRSDITVSDDLTAGDLTVLGDSTLGNTGADTTILYGTLEVAGSGPSVASGATDVAISSKTIAWGNNINFQVNCEAKTTPAVGEICTITLGQARDSSNYGVVFGARSSAASKLGLYATSLSGGGFTISTTTVSGISAGDALNIVCWVTGE